MKDLTRKRWPNPNHPIASVTEGRQSLACAFIWGVGYPVPAARNALTGRFPGPLEAVYPGK